MSVADWIAGSPELRTIGWTIVHSVWQIAVIALILGVASKALRETTARVRYAVACVALAVALALPASTATGIAASWSEHAACWERAHRVPIGDLPADCLDHGFSSRLDGSGEGAASAPVKNAASTSSSDGSATTEPAPARSAATPLPLSHTAALKIAPLTPWLAIVWLIGAAVAAARAAGGWVRVRRVRAAATPLPAGLAERLTALAQRCGVRRHVTFEAAAVDVPAVVGWRTPTVLLPPDATRALERGEFESLVAHELAHVRRSDFAVNSIQSVIDVLLFHHPAARWISNRIRREREYCCDDDAVSTASGSAAAYIRALVAIDVRRTPRPPGPTLAVSGGGRLLERVRRLATRNATRERARRTHIALAATALLLMTLPILDVGEPIHLGAWTMMELDLRARDATGVTATLAADRPVPRMPDSDMGSIGISFDATTPEWYDPGAAAATPTPNP